MAKKTVTPEVPSESLQTRGETAMVEFEYGEEDIGAGYEHQTSADTKVPLLILLQGLSPMVVEGTNDAKAGQWFHTVTQELYDKDTGFLFVPATTRHLFAEWIPRNEGGGFRGHHEITSDEVKQTLNRSEKFGKNKMENGHELVETFYVYGIVCSEDGFADSMGVISFVSTKIRSYKSWMSRLRAFTVRHPTRGSFRPPMYAHLTRITSESQKNEKGQFYIPRITAGNESPIKSLLQKDDDRFIMAKKCKELVDAGDIAVDPNQAMAQDADSDGKAPF